MDRSWQGALSNLNKLLTEAAERLGVPRADVHVALTPDWRWRAWVDREGVTIDVVDTTPPAALDRLVEKTGKS